ncbi:probable cyclic nucleotide-gated ion channel 20, chloroplastic [Vicia villosa]|uniref:probable cyclic nucleotide-gated ion channel 20, chloroplastic n=1 Tax=Vicia villosa TaxID=3911 RepID=UPI00273C936E|nr:probable cyclic nucleotide-gated ion channel 20, chloroplastic [Vicia villosa]
MDEVVTQRTETRPLRGAGNSSLPNFIRRWNRLLAIFCLVSIFIDPLFFFTIHVNKETKCIPINWVIAKALVGMRSITDFVFLLNILLQFWLAYVSPKSRVVEGLTKIALKYFKGYFLIDLCVVIPLPQILFLFLLPNPSKSDGEQHAKKLLIILILVQYILRLFRFLPLLIGQSPSGFIFKSAWASFIINLLFFMLFSHIVGSCWYLFALQRVDQCLIEACHLADLPLCKALIDCNSNFPAISAAWGADLGAGNCFNVTSGDFSYGIYGNALPLTVQASVTGKYIYSLFWGFQQLSTLARNLTPNHFAWEVMFTMSIIGLGLSLFAVLIANIHNFLQGLARRRLEMQLRSRDVEHWMGRRGLSEDLRRRIREAEQNAWEETRGVPDEMILRNLPEGLVSDIRQFQENADHSV